VLASTEATEERFQELTKRIRQKEYIKRSIGKARFQLGPGMEIAVKLYNIVQEVKKPLAKSLLAGSNKLLKGTTRRICEETGAILYDNQIGTYYPYGSEKVVISKEEAKEIKKFDAPGIKLMGFKPRSKLKDYMNIRSSYFVSADDQTISNSSQVMDALIKKMIEKDKIAIVRLIAKETSILRFCALLPQIESVDPEDNFRHPQGFNMIFLPYADDIRSPESIIKREKIVKVNEQQVAAAKLLVKNLSIDFDSRQFENPAIQNFYATIQALALNEKEPEPIVDIMQPDYEGMAKFAAIIEQFKEVTYGDEYNRNEIRGVKGKRQSKNNSGMKKKKVEEEKEDVMDDIMNDRLNEEDEELKSKFEDGTIKSLTTGQLKEILQSRKVKIGKANKEDLLDKLRDYLQV
jgi:ATP-dependent DNA helicase 2 subunit 1